MRIVGRSVPIRTIKHDNSITAAYLAAIVECSDDAIIGKDLQGTIQSWNRGAENIFGYKSKEIIGKNVQILFPKYLIKQEFDILDNIKNGIRVEIFETVRCRKDGSHFPASVRISPIRNAEGEIIGASKTIQDISERRRIYEELQNAKCELERALVERTKALKERDLLIQEVYHRVKNNLQMIDSMLMLQSAKIVDTDARNVMREMRSRVFALGLVHHQLMTSSDMRTFDIAPFLTDLLTNLMGGVSDERIKLTVNACPLDVGLDFALPLGLLVTELVTNSIKHAFRGGGGEIVVALQDDVAGRVKLTVADNGRGQGQEPLSPGRVGSGSSIIKKLVAQLAGEMKVRHNAGTTTEILLPKGDPS